MWRRTLWAWCAAWALFLLACAANAEQPWTLQGNTGTQQGVHFLGTIDNVPLDLRTNNERGLHLEWAHRTGPYGQLHALSVNMIGGHSANTVTAGVVGATIAGGGVDTWKEGGAHTAVPNLVTDDLGTIGGGSGNRAGNNSGGLFDAASATVAGGLLNTAGAIFATVGGGTENVATGGGATIPGGFKNAAIAQYAAIGGGGENAAGGAFATVGGGQKNKASGNQATVSGGQQNAATQTFAAVGGGWRNQASENAATVAGGSQNVATASCATVAGGSQNTASGAAAAVLGGQLNIAKGRSSFAGGVAAHANHDGAFVWADSKIGLVSPLESTGDDQFVIGASGGVFIKGEPGSRLEVSGPGVFGALEVTGSGAFKEVKAGPSVFTSGSAGSAVYATNNGSGSAGAFGIENTGSTSNALDVTTSSKTGAAIHAVTLGQGPALQAINTFGVGKAASFTGNVEVRRYSDGAVVLELGTGLDYAEGFEVTEKAQAGPGMVLVIDPLHPGKLVVSRQPYDRKVAGVVAGAKGLGSGVRLSAGGADSDVALAGRVYCNVDATYGAVRPGDLLTTSPTPGYAMGVKDYATAQGAILGKSMEGLPKGKKGQILILVTLQ